MKKNIVRGIWDFIIRPVTLGVPCLALLAGCASDGKPHPCDAEAIACLMAGGEWKSGPNCGTCEYPDPPPPPPPPPEEVLPPTAAYMEASGLRVEIKPVREGKKGMGATPRGQFGRAYYCAPEVAWPEACAAGRSFGPVAPDGHPKREEWEAHFLGQSCPTFSFQSDTHMSYDPWISIRGINQNHPRNVRVCGQGQFESHASWRTEGRYIVEGQWSWATAHGNGRVCASGKDGVGLFCINYRY